jgi:hypothetical protein
MMIPFFLFLGLGSALAWALRPRDSIGEADLSDTETSRRARIHAAAHPFQESRIPEGVLGPPLVPEEVRLLTLLILWAKDKQFPIGKKRFMTMGLAKELVTLATRLGLLGTANAVLTDGPIPEREKLGRRGITVRAAIVAFNRKGNL